MVEPAATTIDRIAPAAPARISRSRMARPTRAAPWMMWAPGGRAWVWEPQRGLLQLPDFRGEDTDVRLIKDCLAPDGRRFEYIVMSLAYNSIEQSFVADLLTGERGHNPHRSYRMPSYGDGRGSRLYIDDRPDSRPPEGRFTLERDGETRSLGLHESIARNFTGRDVQFAHTGSQAIFAVWDSDAQAVSTLVLDLDSAEVIERHRNVSLVGSAAWSPGGTRVLVFPFDQEFPREAYVLDRTSGDLTPLHPLTGTRRGYVHIAGWIDDTHLLISELHGGRVKVLASNVEDLTHRELVDLPCPRAARRDFRGLFMASEVVYANPGTLLYDHAP